MKNAPRERQAQVMANAVIKAKKQEYPDITKKELKKISQQELSKARIAVGAKSQRIDVTDKEWEAIQAGAISDNRLKIILDNSDPDILRERAMPKAGKSPTNAQVARMKALANSNFTIKEIAEKMNLSSSTVSKYLKGGK